MKITYSVAASEDGFIAREDGDVSWLEEMKIDPSETGLAEFFAEVDALVMGRKSYDFVFEYGSWPYEKKPSWVCTSRELEALDGANLMVVNQIEDVMEQAKSKNMKHLWLLGGGSLASAFLDKQWLTHISIAEMPIQLETGIPLFANHKIEELEIENKEVIQKKGFKVVNMDVRYGS